MEYDSFRRFFERETGAYEFATQQLPSTTWRYSGLRSYLCGLMDSGAVMPARLFPKRIELISPWHQTLGEMRKLTRDGHERFAFISGVRGKDTLHLPTRYTVAKNTLPIAHVTHAEMVEEFSKILRNGDTHAIGTIHSHPSHYRGAERLIRNLLGIQEAARFSPGDFFNFVHKDISWGALMVVVGPSTNIFTFLTQESIELQETGYPPDQIGQDAFATMWYTGGYTIDRRLKEAFDKSTNDLALIFNAAIAAKYRLILYEGQPGQELSRIFPK